MIEIDGSMHSGSGTILRYAVSLATLRGEPLHMYRIRARRSKPGLRPQHLQALRACCSMCAGQLEGDGVGSQEVYFSPGRHLHGGDFAWDIGTAGSTTMLAFTALPVALFANNPCRFHITGGLFQDFAPSAFHMQNVLFPLLQRMGVNSDAGMEIVRPGYVPKGQGELTVVVKPLDSPLEPLRMLEQGTVKGVRGISLASHLDKEQVSERMARRCASLLENYGFRPDIQICRDVTAVQPGAVLAVWAETDKRCILGADQAGKPGRRSESIADFVVSSLVEDINTSATTDRHLADQLILFAALANGKTTYLIPKITDHVQSNLWLVSKILGAQATISGRQLEIEGVGFFRSRESNAGTGLGHDNSD